MEQVLELPLCLEFEEITEKVTWELYFSRVVLGKLQHIEEERAKYHHSIGNMISVDIISLIV